MKPPVTQSIRATTVVSGAPEAIFRKFTEEIHLWYRVDRHTVPNAEKTVSVRIEPGVGGRFLAVHDEASGQGDAMGEVTAWNPPAGFVFRDLRGCEVAVDFAVCDEGTAVSVELRSIDALPEDQGASVRKYGWHTILPWFADNERAALPAVRYAGMVTYLFYDDAAAMLDWYARVFGFRETGRWTDTDGRVHNAEMSLGESELWLDGSGRRHLTDGAPQWIGVWTDDLEAVHSRLRKAGMDVPAPQEKEYGVRMLTVNDPEGYMWGFMSRLGG